MPYAKKTLTTCTGCGIEYFSTAQQAQQKHHFHTRQCRAIWQTGKPRSDRGTKAISIDCAFCGKAFKAGGRNAIGKRLPNKDAMYHSRSCARRAREVEGEQCLELPADFKEWLAQYFDGEGSAFMVVQGHSRKPLPQVTIGATDRDAIEEILHRTGVGAVSLRRSKDVNHRDLYMWKCVADAALGFLRQLFPLLIIKHAIAEFVLTACKEMEAQPMLAYDLQWRAEVLRTSKTLNQRGPDGVAARREKRPERAAARFRNLLKGDNYLPLNMLGIKELLPAPPQERKPVKPGWKICPVCGEQFRKRSRTTVRHPSATCSKKCAYVYRRRRGNPCRKVAKPVARSIAASLDAEGCIRVVASSTTINAQIHFGNTNKLAVELISEAVGGGAIALRPAKKAEHADSWHWRCQADTAQGLLEQVLPYMRTKSRQAKLALYVQERLALPQSRCDRRWQQEALRVSHLLNSKGRAIIIPKVIPVAGGNFNI